MMNEERNSNGECGNVCSHLGFYSAFIIPHFAFRPRVCIYRGSDVYSSPVSALRLAGPRQARGRYP